MAEKRTTMEVSASELKAFLTYFYYIEQAAQGEGYNTSSKWTEPASRFHDKMMKAEQRVGVYVRAD